MGKSSINGPFSSIFHGYVSYHEFWPIEEPPTKQSELLNDCFCEHPGYNNNCKVFRLEKMGGRGSEHWHPRTPSAMLLPSYARP